jgi:ketol-acid reductoisomerase
MYVRQLQIIKSDDIRISNLASVNVSVIGYGNQGRAHALNLRDSGIAITVGVRNPNHALEDGFQPKSIADASANADLIIIALPDDIHAEVFHSHIKPSMKPSATIGFIHGFSIHYDHISPENGIGVVMVAPKGPGVTVRNRFLEGSGVPALLAIDQENAEGNARDLALGWAAGIGSGRVGVFESTFKDETETDLFGEQAIIVGGLVALIKASFETLVNAGYPPELAYIECCHEVKQVADIIHQKGIAQMMSDISDTAEMGAYEAMELIDDEHLRTHLRTLLENVQDGSFAKRLIRNEIKNKREELGKHDIEKVGNEMRRVLLSDDD